VLLVVPFRAVGTDPDGSPVIAGMEPLALTRGETRTSEGTDFSVDPRAFREKTLLIAKKDPGAAIVWAAFGLLLVGLLITFWMPRRRVWGRLDADGRLALVFLADRYVDVGREFGRLLDDLVAARRPGADAGATGAGAGATDADAAVMDASAEGPDKRATRPSDGGGTT
jgi:hypothetical protein